MSIGLSPELSSPRKDFCGFWCEYCEGFCSVPKTRRNWNVQFFIPSSANKYDVMTSTHRKLQNIVNDMSSANSDKLNPTISSVRVRPAISIFIYFMRMETKYYEIRLWIFITVSIFNHTRTCASTSFPPAYNLFKSWIISREKQEVKFVHPFGYCRRVVPGFTSHSPSELQRRSTYSG